MEIMRVKPQSTIDTLSARKLLKDRPANNLRRLEISVKAGHCQDSRIYRIPKDTHITVL